MLFLGYAIYGGKHSADVHPTAITDIKQTVLENVIADGLYLTKETGEKVGQTIPTVAEWNFDTILNAPFEGSLLGGNVSFTADQILCMRLKRAEADSYQWLTLCEIPIRTNEDLDFTRIDRTARGSQEFKYALVPVWNDNIEGNYNINTIRSSFDGLWIVEKDMAAHALLNLEMNTSRNIVTSSVVPLGRKYACVHQYGKANYTSGSLSAVFVRLDEETCEPDIRGGARYREQLEDFLTNGAPKIIKHQDGRIWLASITDAISKNEGSRFELPVQTVHFMEIGRFDSSSDLYDADLIEVNLEREVEDYGLLSFSV